jgi:hypothetical protein
VLAALKNEEHTLDNTVEAASLVSESLLAGAEGSEVFSSLGDNIGEQLELDSALRNTANGDIEEDLRVGHRME